MIERIIKPLLEEAYNKGYIAGVTARDAINAKQELHRMEDMLERGKKLGYTEGAEAGYRLGCEDGYEKAKAEAGIIEIDDLIDDMEAV